MRKKIYYIFLTAVLCLTLVNQIQADYQSTVLPDNPLLYFRFEDADMSDGSPVADMGSVGRGGTYMGDSISPITSAPCLGQAAHLGQENISEGGGDCVSVDDSDFVFGLPDVTYEAWIKIAPGDLAYSRIFQHNGSWEELGAPGVMMYTYEYGIIGGDTTNYGFEAPTDDGYWHHVVVTYDSGVSNVIEELYVDGVSIGTAAGPSDLSYVFDSIMLGCEGSQWYRYNGLKGAIDEFAIYEGILSTDRILAHYVASIDCDECPDDPYKTEPGICGCGVPDTDSDGDGPPDCIDNCPNDYNPEQVDSDTDDVGDTCDNCPFTYNPGQKDINGDGRGDACQLDFDNDGFDDIEDNCPATPNPDQNDIDNDDRGDVCDLCPVDPNDICADANSIVGPEGGIVANGAGTASVEIPPGALDVNTPISITGETGIGNYAICRAAHILEAGYIYTFDPAGCNFDVPVTITLTYNQAVIQGDDCTDSNCDCTGTPVELSMDIYYYDANEGWMPQGAIQDCNSNTLTLEVDSFSSFAVILIRDSDNDEVLDPDDNCPYVYNPGQADSDGDGIGDVCECYAANINGVNPVNFNDFSMLASGWQLAISDLAGDTNRDDTVDFIDLLQVVEHWLDECGQP